MKKGVSLIVLTIVAIVILILASATTISVINSQKKVKTLEFANEIAMVQEKVNLYYKKYNKYPIRNELDTTTINVEKNVEQFNGEDIESNIVTLNYVDLSEIFEDSSSYTDELHILRYGHNKSENDLYLISTKTGRVYYKATIYDYYTLTQELKEKINYVEESDGMLAVSKILFQKSESDYINTPIITTIKIPQDYVVKSCNVVKEDLSSVELTSIKKENGYSIYVTPNDINQNYTVIVNWLDTQNAKENYTSFAVDNFDNTIPELEIVGDKKEIINNITGEKSIFYYLDYSDNKSGVSEVKYAEHRIISDEESNYNKNLEIVRRYMENNGIKVNLYSINISSGTRYVTVYIKDNAGNDKYLIKEVPEIEKVGDLEI